MFQKTTVIRTAFCGGVRDVRRRRATAWRFVSAVLFLAAILAGVTIGCARNRGMADYGSCVIAHHDTELVCIPLSRHLKRQLKRDKAAAVNEGLSVSDSEDDTSAQTPRQ